MATHKAKAHHLAKEHQCPDPASCQGCIDSSQRRPRGPTNDNQKVGKFKCHHDDCTKSYINADPLLQHCKKQHKCPSTYGSCINIREYRNQKYHALHDDTQTIERFLAEGFLRCDHPECIYFFKTGNSKQEHMIQRHQCSDPHGCEACVKRNFHIDNGDNDDVGEYKPQVQPDGRRIRLPRRLRTIISGELVSPKKWITNTKTNNPTAFVKPNQVGVWNESMFNLIKCPLIGCEECPVTMIVLTTMMHTELIGC
ncbi:hypothetical protein SAMD00019534_091430 [Acytostelium subglobosum LB1]|uniref:hypothetical protein n=1 Tax=Acytostelium subglobosum LB1 TaxID=1410327 RepID=UPI00064487CE|nr:hypothetical protein SAMD00019534_091430 [Acytostelium subglobosum LB1]GAM25968.1 hypothetical protein SAMD00019534_091430 [Acytostelium subglobosum LB1]|eukprot:XP_012751011.1 hypothetical protein SAMD00019534_091430 [Acytostelium subglobosum LB1]